MKGNDELNLTACLLALLRYSDSLPSELSAQLQQVSTQLSDNPHRAIQTLRATIQDHPDLKRLYEASRTQLYSQYAPPERAKLAVSSRSDLDRPQAPSVEPPSVAVEKTRSKSSAKNGLVTERDRIDIVQLATAILNSPNANYRTQTQKLFNQPTIKRQLEHTPDTLKASVEALEKAAKEVHPTKVALMKRLDQRILTVDDLAYALGISIESARQYVKTLWNESYVRPISGNFIQQIWLSIKGPAPIDAPPADDTYLKLTAKGYFYLHPSSLSKRKVA